MAYFYTSWISPCGFSNSGPLGLEGYNPPGRLGVTHGPLKLENGPSDFYEIWPKVAEYGLSSLATNVYTWKNVDVKIIHLFLYRLIGLRKGFLSLGINRNYT